MVQEYAIESPYYYMSCDCDAFFTDENGVKRKAI